MGRLYDPTDGRVLIDGVPLTEFNPAGWQKRVSAGFRHYATLRFLAAETVGVGELDAGMNRRRVTAAVAAWPGRLGRRGAARRARHELGTAVGTHTQLLAVGGRSAELFAPQARGYR